MIGKRKNRDGGGAKAKKNFPLPHPPPSNMGV